MGNNRFLLLRVAYREIGKELVTPLPLILRTIQLLLEESYKESSCILQMRVDSDAKMTIRAYLTAKV